jgi:hypothetical protein
MIFYATTESTSRHTYSEIVQTVTMPPWMHNPSPDILIRANPHLDIETIDAAVQEAVRNGACVIIDEFDALRVDVVEELRARYVDHPKIVIVAIPIALHATTS